MTSLELQSLLLWSAALHYALLVVSFLAWRAAAPALFRVHARWFGLDRARYDALAFLILGLWKLGIWLFFLVPGLVLWLMHRTG